MEGMPNRNLIYTSLRLHRPRNPFFRLISCPYDALASLFPVLWVVSLLYGLLIF